MGCGRRESRTAQSDLVDRCRARGLLGVVDLVGDGVVHAAGRVSHRRSGKFVLVAVPTVVGAVLRIPYASAVTRFGGRNWTIFSALILLVPAALTLYFAGAPRNLLHHLRSGVGLRRPRWRQFRLLDGQHQCVLPATSQGWALGLNAGGGNIGVAAVQLIGLMVIATVGNRSPQLVCATYLVLIGVAAVGASFFMDNLTNHESNARVMIDVLAYRDSWLIALLYIGTFGSFIGFGFAFGQVLQINFVAALADGGRATPP